MSIKLKVSIPHIKFIFNQCTNNLLNNKDWEKRYDEVSKDYTASDLLYNCGIKIVLVALKFEWEKPDGFLSVGVWCFILQGKSGFANLV